MSDNQHVALGVLLLVQLTIIWQNHSFSATILVGAVVLCCSQDFTQQQSARCTAEAAEAKALKLAADRAQIFEALLSEVQQGSLTAYRHARLTRQGQHNGKAVQQAAFAAVQQQNQQQGQHPETAASGTCTSTNIGPGSTLSTGAANATAEADPADTTEARAKQRHSLLKAAAADKKVLAKLAAARRRAEAAAQLEQSSKVCSRPVIVLTSAGCN